MLAHASTRQRGCGGVGKDADAKFLWKRAGGKLNYSRHTRIPSLR